MNESEAAFVLAELGYANINIGNGVVKAQCPCSSRGDTTFRIICGSGHPGYFCHRCKSSGSVLGLVWSRILSEKRPYTKALYVVNESIINQSEARLVPGRMDYKPFGDRAVEKKGAPKPTYRPVVGVQLDLQGRVAKRLPPKPFREKDFQRFKRGNQQYMRGRGFTDEVIDAYEVRENPGDRRVVFPIRDWDGTIKGVSQRLVWDQDWCFRCKTSLLTGKVGPDGTPQLHYKCPKCRKLYAKYLHSKGLRRNEVLYGEWLCTDEVRAVVLVEGMTDVLNLWQHGMRPANGILVLGVMGSHPGEWQIARVLAHLPSVPVVVVRDRDDPDEHPELPEGVAPGDLMVEKVRKYVHAREPERVVFEIVPDTLKVDPGDFLENHVQVAIGVIEEVVKGGLTSGSFSLAI
jgi:hypothetical protein